VKKPERFFHYSFTHLITNPQNYVKQIEYFSENQYPKIGDYFGNVRLIVNFNVTNSNQNISMQSLIQPYFITVFG
jgi:hypothetical protein